MSASRILGSAALLAAITAPAGAQSLAARIAAAPEGDVRLSFAAREGVCGNGTTMIRDGGRTTMWENHRGDEWEQVCDPGPVHVVVRKRGDDIVRLRTYVGGRWRGSDATDLGAVSAPEAARFLLSLATREHGRVGKEAILPATLADSAVVWPDLLRIARASDVPRDTRQAAVFWLGQAAEEAATAGLDSLVDDADEDIEVREHAIFALSQRPREEGIPALIEVARSSPSPRLRGKALFWLGQSDDPRAIGLFEEILTKP